MGRRVYSHPSLYDLTTQWAEGVFLQHLPSVVAAHVLGGDSVSYCITGLRSVFFERSVSATILCDLLRLVFSGLNLASLLRTCERVAASF